MPLILAMLSSAVVASMILAGDGHVPAIWMADAVAVAAVVEGAGRPVRSVLAALLLVSFAGALAIGGTPLESAIFAALHGTNLLLAVGILQLVEFKRGRRDVGAPRFIQVIAVVGLAAPVPSGVLFGLWTAVSATADPVATTAAWWSSALVGAALVLPLISGPAVAVRPLRWAPVCAATAAVAGATLVTVTAAEHPIAYLGLTLAVAAVALSPRELAVAAAGGALVCLGFEVHSGATLDADLRIGIAVAITLPYVAALVTAQLREEQASLEASRERYRGVVRDSTIGIALVCLDGRIWEANPALAAMLGYRPEDLVGRRVRDVTHPHDVEVGRDAVLEAIRAASSGMAMSYRFERRCMRRDGTSFWAQVSGSVLRDSPSGTVRYLILQVEDIDNRKQVEAALQESESRWTFALEAAGQGVWDADLVRGTCFYSPSWWRMLGHDGTDVECDDVWLHFIHPEDRDAAIEAGERHKRGETAVAEAEFRMRHADGRWVWMLDRGKVVARDAEGRPTRMIGIQTDITRLKEAEAEIALMHERVRLAVEAGGIGLWEIDAATGRVSYDRAVLDAVGVFGSSNGGSLAGWAACIHPDDREAELARLQRSLETGEAYAGEYRILRPGAAPSHVRALARMVRGDRGDCLVGALWDVTDQVRNAEQLHTEKERLRITLHSIGDAVICTDLNDRITFMNRAAEVLTGIAEYSALGEPLRGVFRVAEEGSGVDRASPAEEAMAGCRSVEHDEPGLLIRRDGDRRSVRELATPVLAPSGEVLGAVIVAQDVTHARAMQRDLAHAAAHDALTGLKNRASLEGALLRALRQAQGEAKTHALLYIDLDRFKMVNDVAGHQAGDALLREVARIVERVARPGDVPARLGGDEFALLAIGADETLAEALAADIVASVSGLRFAWEGKIHHIGASVGVAVIGESELDVAALLAQADVACYAAKAGGRNRVSVYRADSGEAHRHLSELRVASGIRTAMEQGRLLLYGQEIRDLSAPLRRGSRLEILSRLRGPDGTIAPPGAFIPAAERLAMMADFDRWVISTLLRDHGKAIMAVPDLRVSVNLSANSLSEPGFATALEDLFAKTGFDPRRLELEITETAMINNFIAAERLVERARAAGCRISLDDFGSGVSSFAYLKRFRVDTIKVDGAFVTHVTSDPYDRTIVRLIGEIGRDFGVDTVAECIEDEQTFLTVRDLGIGYGQGYLFHRPRPLEEMLGLAPAESAADRKAIAV